MLVAALIVFGVTFGLGWWWFRYHVHIPVMKETTVTVYKTGIGAQTRGKPRWEVRRK